MTVYVHSLYAAPSGDQAISPELVLVDPALAATARAHLAEPGALVPRDAARIAVPLRQTPRTSDSSIRRLETSKRVLVGVAAVTMLVLLLFDVRVEVGQRQASAEPRADQAPPTPASPKPPTSRPTPISKARSRPTERKFAWVRVAGADAYHVEFFRGQNRVFMQDTPGPDITVPARWTYQGSSRSFRPGEYRWYVWPIVSGLRQSRAAVQSTVTIQAN